MRLLQVNTQNRNVRAALAAAFLFVLISEWGSHSVVCADHSSVDARSMSARQNGHEDPCQTLVLCSDNKQRDQQLPKLGHDATQHNGLLDVLAGLRPKLVATRDIPIPFATGDGLFRPSKPPFHPPKQA